MATSKEAEASWTFCSGYISTDTLDRKSADMFQCCLSVVKILKYFHIRGKIVISLSSQVPPIPLLIFVC